VSELRPGDRIADRYRVEDVIARGGMGAVYRATDERLERSVAVKVLLTELGDDRVSIARFEREARATAQLSHPSIVSVLDFGTTPEGVSYLVMEHVVGTTLSEILDRGRLAPGRAADIVEQACGALAVAHAAGIVHRDLKPGNLMIVPIGEGGRELVKVLDFGIAQLKSGTAYTRLTQTGVVVGTPSYMSPEQARGEPCDARTDVYAIGMVLWCCLTGTRPFKKDHVAGLVQAVQAEVPPRADQIVPDVPPMLAAIAAQALEKLPEARFASVSELASRLVAARGVRAASSAAPATRRSPELPTAATSAVRPGAGSPAPIAPRAPIAPAPVAHLAAAPTKRRTWPRVLGCFVALSAILAIAVVVVAVVGIAYLKQANLLPTFPSGGLPSPSPRSSGVPDDPSYGVPLCAQALACCRAYTEQVQPMMASCDQVVGFSQGDLPSCQRQLEMWRDFAREAGTPLDVCE
jgi:serine/threonine protein kinase